MDTFVVCTKCGLTMSPFQAHSHHCVPPEEMTDRELLEDTNKRLRQL